jgi:hypothetical protein
MSTEQACPLQWPAGWKRTASGARVRARFRRRERKQLTTSEALKRLEGQLRRLGAQLPVLSSNITLTLGGTPRSGENPNDPGIAVYFTLKDKRLVLACDRWLSAADNIAAIAAHIDALRGQERWGVGTAEQAFAGYTALPAPDQINWRTILGISPGTEPDLASIENRYRELAAQHHPDHGGSSDQMIELNRAVQEARRELSTN